MADCKVGSILSLKGAALHEDKRTWNKNVLYSVILHGGINGVLKSARKKPTTNDILSTNFVVCEKTNSAGEIAMYKIKPKDNKSNVEYIMFMCQPSLLEQAVQSDAIQVVGQEIDLAWILSKADLEKVEESRKHIDRLFFNPEIFGEGSADVYKDVCSAAINTGVSPRSMTCSCGKKCLDGHMSCADIDPARIQAIKANITESMGLASENDINKFSQKSLSCIDGDLEIIVFKVNDSAQLMRIPLGWLHGYGAMDVEE